MNLNYLIQTTAQTLETIVRVFTPDKQYSSEKSYHYKSSSPNLLSSDIIDRFFQNIDYTCPVLSSINRNYVYAAVYTDTDYYLIGPVCLDMKLEIKHNYEVDLDQSVFTEYNTPFDFNTYKKVILLFYNLLSDTPISEIDLIVRNCVSTIGNEAITYSSNLIFENRENEIRHNPYDQEFRMLASIENGDLKMLEQTQEEVSTGVFGKLSPNASRSARNVSISAITLISRAAIRGGLHPEIAFSMCDSYIMKIEELRNLVELQPLVEGAKRTFTIMVHNLKQRTHNEKNLPETHPLIEQAKDYIFSHLHGKITLHEVADELNVRSNYLSDLFRKYEGISFTDFVLQEKLALVKNLLTYSNYSFNDIASYLGFSSQSHLGSFFKSSTGMTLKQYRNKYFSVDF
ncbi:MAG: helix-turn-helix domain-containing protein [Lachnospiraceae bacterium]|nr:helix-turn-helix domain-containing protein [Lachnospiraceae bacterium]